MMSEDDALRPGTPGDSKLFVSAAADDGEHLPGRLPDTEIEHALWVTCVF